MVSFAVDDPLFFILLAQLFRVLQAPAIRHAPQIAGRAASSASSTKLHLAAGSRTDPDLSAADSRITYVTAPPDRQNGRFANGFAFVPQGANVTTANKDVDHPGTGLNNSVALAGAGRTGEACEG
jgi:hypothetical protein